MMREKASLEREGVSREVQDPSGEPPQHKKQVRRRLHTRKPYQEKLLNMAEARREIVSALKLHRASMKQATEKQESAGPGFQTGEVKSRRNPRIYASNSYSSTTSDEFPVINYSENYYNHIYNPTGSCSPYSWSVPSTAPPPIFRENLDFVLPNQTLGLNLNLQDFITNTPSSIYSSSSPSTSSSPPPSAAAEEIPVVDHNLQIERFEFIKYSTEEFVSPPFDEVMEFPAWLNANESYSQHVNDFHNFQDQAALPCMEIEEIEGTDGDWLA